MVFFVILLRKSDLQCFSKFLFPFTCLFEVFADIHCTRHLFFEAGFQVADRVGQVFDGRGLLRGELAEAGERAGCGGFGVGEGGGGLLQAGVEEVVSERTNEAMKSRESGVNDEKDKVRSKSHKKLPFYA